MIAGSKSRGMSYHGWSDFRNQIITIAFMHLQKKIESANETSEVEEPTYREVEIAQDLCKEMTTNNHNTEDIFYIFLGKMLASPDSKLNALINFDLGGLYALCLKNDCQGYYSAGNSLDICNMFDLLKEDIKKYDERLYEVIYECKSDDDTIYSIFEESWKKNIPVCIC